VGKDAGDELGVRGTGGFLEMLEKNHGNPTGKFILRDYKLFHPYF